MQARLPDINTTLVTYRSAILKALHLQQHAACTKYLYVFNSILPEEYRVKVDSEAWKQKVASKHIAVCYKCSKETEYSTAKKAPEYTSALVCMITGQKKVNRWFCNTCGAYRLAELTDFALDVRAEPSLFGIVQEPPMRWGQGYSKHTYHKAYEAWALDFVKELEAKGSAYRRDWGEQQADDSEGMADDDLT